MIEPDGTELTVELDQVEQIALLRLLNANADTSHVAALRRLERTVERALYDRLTIEEVERLRQEICPEVVDEKKRAHPLKT